MQKQFMVTVAVLLTTVALARADDEALLVRALKFSREFFEKAHLIAEVNLQQRGEESLPRRFSYERRPDGEQIKTELGQTFARKKGQGWSRSNDWGKTGVPATANEVADLASRIYLVNAPWTPNLSPHDSVQGADVTNLVTHTNDEAGEHLVFERTRAEPIKTAYPRYKFVRPGNSPKSNPVLEQFSGPVAIGNQKVFLTVQ